MYREIRPRSAAVLAITLVAGGLIAKCALSGTKYRRFTSADRCMAMPVYAGPAGPLIGNLAGGGLFDPGNGGKPVNAINISVVVDGGVRSVWRREPETRNWYVPMGVISAANCRWTPADLYQGAWKPSRLEFGLDVPLWHHFLRRGWSTRGGLLATDSI